MDNSLDLAVSYSKGNKQQICDNVYELWMVYMIILPLSNLKVSLMCQYNLQYETREFWKNYWSFWEAS